MNFDIVAAMTEDRVIGYKGNIPWEGEVEGEQRLFRSLTTGNNVIMGRKTYESIPNEYTPLPDRENIVLSNSMDEVEDENVSICRSIDDVVEEVSNNSDRNFVAGGETVYESFLNDPELPVRKMYLSFIKEDYEGDTFFPDFDENNWFLNGAEDYDDFVFRIYQR